jgi:hypothetical protein
MHHDKVVHEARVVLRCSRHPQRMHACRRAVVHGLHHECQRSEHHTEHSSGQGSGQCREQCSRQHRIVVVDLGVPAVDIVVSDAGLCRGTSVGVHGSNEWLAEVQ